MNLLITSVGSLLGQNILDCVETRRDLISVVGMNSVAANSRNFRCDKVYFTHETHNTTFHEEFIEIVEKEKPDLILPGRDEDCVFLADFKKDNFKKFQNIIPFGSSVIPEMMFDKYKSHLFCMENDLPFADTFLYHSNSNKADLEKFIRAHGFPLLVKPKEGFGSIGVRFVLNQNQVDENLKNQEVLFQEYLGNPDDIFKYEDAFKSGIPLFFQLPEREQFAAQTIISPEGKIGEVFFTVNTMVHGRAEYGKQVFDKDVEDLVIKSSKIFFKHGWYGPVNFQVKKDRNGMWRIFELNPRLTGTSSGRLLLGYDEFGILVNMFAPKFNIPNLTKNPKIKGQLFKYLSDYLLPDDDVEVLKKDKIWKKF